MFAVIRVRGSVNVKKENKDTLRMLRLERVNRCTLVSETPDFEGMLKSARSYITWGKIDRAVLEKLITKRGRTAGDKKLSKEDAKNAVKFIEENSSLKTNGLKPVFRLSPPRKGYKSIRADFPKGDLGFRGEKINDLLKRMI